MKHMIDHAIMIPASSTRIWQELSNIANNPNWQANCQQVAFLTTLKTGKGARLRITHDNGQESVMEITAWYNDIGYEYKIVDGASFADNLGRIRMQEVAEGTVVEWTFQYDLSGVLSGIRNSLNTKRQYDRHITQSLRNLYTYIRDEEQNQVAEHLPAAIRPAPTVEERQKYQPKHPSAYESAKDDTSEHPAVDFTPPPLDLEPALKDDDTRPNPSMNVPEDTREDVAQSDVAQPTYDRQSTTSNIEDMSSEDVLNKEDKWISVPPIDTTSSDSGISDVNDQQIAEQKTVQEQEKQSSDNLPSAPPPRTPIDPKLDTAQVSVFDIFGVPKPSKTQEMRAVQENDSASASTIVQTQEHQALDLQNADEGKQVNDSASEGLGRIGQRLRQRRNMAQLRRPS
jgi:hypothetical protein